MSDDRLEKLVRETAARAWRTAVGLVGREADADDLVQQAFLVAARKRDAIPAGDAWPWLARVLVLECRNMRRRSRLDPVGDDVMLTPDERTGDPQALAADAELVAAVKRELADLSAEEREAIVLTHVTGLSFREAAKAADTPAATLSDRASRAMDRLRRRVALGEGSLAGLLAVLPTAPPPGGFEAATAGWLAAAQGGTGAAVAATSIGGAVVAKNVVLACVVVALCVFGYLGVDALSSDDAPELSSRGGAAEVVREDGVVPERVPDDVATGPPAPAAEPVESRAPIGRLAGRVVDEADRPVAGARVTVVEEHPFVFGFIRAQGDPHEQSVVADGEGRFEVAVECAVEQLDERYSFHVEASAEGRVGTATVTMFLERDGVLDDVVIRLYEPRAAVGRVVDRVDSKPLAGIRVAASAGSPREASLGSYLLDRTAVTDAEGRFRLPGLPAGAVVTFEVAFPDGEGEWREPLSRLRESVEVPREGETPEVELRVSANTLRLAIAPGGPERVSIQTDIADGHTVRGLSTSRDTNEEIVLPGLDERFLGVSITASGWESVRRRASVAPGEDLDLGVVHMKRLGGVLRGRVLRDDGDVVARAMVSAQARDGGVVWCTAAEDGTYELSGAKEGECTVWASHTDHGRCETTVTVGAEPVERDLVIERAGAVTGHVTLGGVPPTARERGADGRETRVKVVIDEASHAHLPMRAGDVRNSGPSALIGADGAFAFPNIPPGRYVVAAEYEGRVAWRGDVRLEGRETVDVALDIGPGGVVHGSVLGPDGAGRAGANVRLAATAQSIRDTHRGRSTTTDEKGSFRFEGVAAGTWYLKLRGESLLAGSELEERRVVVHDGGTTRIDVKLDDGTGPGITGRVLVADESRFDEALLVMPGRLMPSHRAGLSENGEFSMRGVAPGRYYLWFTDSIYRPRFLHREIVEIETAESHVYIERNLDLASITGSVPGAAGGAITIRPALEDTLGADAAARFAVIHAPVGKDGTFTVDAVVAGTYEISSVVPDQASRTVEVDVRGATRVELAAGGEAGQVVVHLRGLDGFPPQGARTDGDPLEGLAVIALFADDGRDLAEAAGDGRMLPLQPGLQRTIGGVPAGEYRLVVAGRTLETFETRVAVKAEGDTSVEVRLQRAAEVIVAFGNEDLDVAALRAATVTARDAGGAEVRELSQPFSGLDDGLALARRELRVAPLRAGRYTITIAVPGHRPCEVTASVRRGEVERVKTRLERE